MKKEFKKLIKVTKKDLQSIELINVKTGAIEDKIVTAKQIILQLNKHYVCINLNRYNPNKTSINTSIDLDYSKELNILELTVLFTAVKEQLALHSKDFDHLDVANLYEQREHRQTVYNTIKKEEERYTKKLLLDEIKRIAKENVDAKRPPVTSVIRTSKKPLELTSGVPILGVKEDSTSDCNM